MEGEAWAQAFLALSHHAFTSEHAGDTNDAAPGNAGSENTAAAASVPMSHDADENPEHTEQLLARSIRTSGR